MRRVETLLRNAAMLAAFFFLSSLTSASASESNRPQFGTSAPKRQSHFDLTAGRDYVEITNGKPFLSGDGKIEVIEVFGYVCPACARFHPLVSKWAMRLPADVRFQYLPAPWGRDWDPYARGFYAADSMNLVPRTHDALIKAIHLDGTMPGEGKSPTDAVVARFYSRYGVDEDVFLAEMHSFTTDTQMRRGKSFIASSGVDGTPTLIVAGKYRVTGKTYDDSLRIATKLIDQVRKGAIGR